RHPARLASDLAGAKVMTLYILRRLGFLVLTLLLTSIIIFAISQLLPGDIARIKLGREASDEAVAALRVKLGLNDPAPVRYVRWLSGFVQGDWETSYPDGSPVFPLVMDRLTKSIWLAGVTLVIAVPLSIALGVLAGLNANKPIDGIISVSSLALVGFPEFVSGIILIGLLSYQLHWLPAASPLTRNATFQQALPPLILPALTATLVLLAYVIRLTRAGVIEVLKKAYVRTAVLKGLPWHKVVTSHILRNALLPTI